jgi:C4-dicarboxylate transporter, DctM subunit
VVAASFLNFVMSSIGLTDAITRSISSLGLSPGWMLLVIVLFYLVLGCFMETLSMMITTIPVVAPVMAALGFDPVWVGVVVVIMVEVALITPPVGLNLFVVQSIRKGGSMNTVIAGALPFVLCMLALIGLLYAFPDLALAVPRFFS